MIRMMVSARPHRRSIPHLHCYLVVLASILFAACSVLLLAEAEYVPVIKRSIAELNYENVELGDILDASTNTVTSTYGDHHGIWSQRLIDNYKKTTNSPESYKYGHRQGVIVHDEDRSAYTGSVGVGFGLDLPLPSSWFDVKVEPKADITYSSTTKKYTLTMDFGWSGRTTTDTVQWAKLIGSDDDEAPSTTLYQQVLREHPEPRQYVAVAITRGFDARCSFRHDADTNEKATKAAAAITGKLNLLTLVTKSFKKQTEDKQFLWGTSFKDPRGRSADDAVAAAIDEVLDAADDRRRLPDVWKALSLRSRTRVRRKVEPFFPFHFVRVFCSGDIVGLQGDISFDTFVNTFAKIKAGPTFMYDHPEKFAVKEVEFVDLKKLYPMHPNWAASLEASIRLLMTRESS